MKILILTDAIEPFSHGGAQKSAYDMWQGYKKKGHQVIVATTVQDIRLDQSKNILSNVYKFYADYHDRWRGFFSLWNPSLLGKLRKVLEKEKPDIVHVHNIHKYFSYSSLALIKKMGIPLVLTIHDCMPICYKKFTCFINKNDLAACGSDKRYKVSFWRCLACQRGRLLINPFRNYFVRYFIKKYPDKVIAVSQELQKLLRINGIRCDDFIHHGVDMDKFVTNEAQAISFKNEYKLNNKKIIFFGGRVSEAKGIDYLIKAVDFLYEKRQDFLLLIAGDKNYNVAHFRYDRILTVGWLSQEKLNAAYTCADVVVYPSICFDTFGLINLEAMAMKKPVVATCFGGSKEVVIDGQTGFIVNPFDVKLMIEKIEYLLDNPNKAKEMGEAGYRRVVEKFTRRKEIELYLHIFNMFLHKTGHV